jgi:hypothetical protein
MAGGVVAWMASKRIGQNESEAAEAISERTISSKKTCVKREFFHTPGTETQAQVINTTSSSIVVAGNTIV